jgi:hypothetical protein
MEQFASKDQHRLIWIKTRVASPKPIRSSGLPCTPRRDPMGTSKVEDHRGIGFPVGHSLSGILLTVFGYFAMILAQ